MGALTVGFKMKKTFSLAFCMRLNIFLVLSSHRDFVSVSTAQNFHCIEFKRKIFPAAAIRVILENEAQCCLVKQR